jgi:hypothetical protein
MNASGESRVLAEMMTGTVLRAVRDCCSAVSDISEGCPYLQKDSD